MGVVTDDFVVVVISFPRQAAMQLKSIPIATNTIAIRFIMVPPFA
jgi:hypothetical protein